MKTKGIVDLLCKIFIQCDTDSCSEHKSVGVNIYFYVCANSLVPVCVLCVFIFNVKTHAYVKPVVSVTPFGY